MTERWLPVVEWEGVYEVSDLGKVRSLPRSAVCKNGAIKRYKGQLLKPNIHPIGGYHVYHLTSPRRTRTAHVLVMRAFVGPPPPGMEVRHLDSNPANNCLTNFEYGTRLDNMEDQRQNGTHGNTQKILCPRGHLLVSPNLMPYFAKKGQRNCLACSRARARIGHNLRRGNPVPKLRELADAIYSQIMTGGK